MASNTKNVKLGVCQAFLGGVDLGYTMGGVEVTVATETHEVTVDQFGKTAINEYLMGRTVKAKVPMVETTLENMVLAMPGAVITQTGGSNATGTLTVTTNPAAGETVIINGATVTFRAALTGVGNEVLLGADAAATAVALAAALNASTDPAIAQASYAVAGAVVTATYGNAQIYGTTGKKSAEGNAFTLNAGTAGADVTLSGATLTGGVNATSVRVDVGTGIGIDLLAIAKELRLHPVSKTANDKSEDFVIPLAATAGALQFSYKLEDERVFPVEFTGYPDSVTGKVYYVGA